MLWMKNNKLSLLIVSVLFLLSACRKEEIKTEFIVNGESDYVIIQPSKADDHTKEAAKALQKAIYDETGYELPIKKDNQRADVGDIDSAKEVLIGNTNRTESQQVLSKIQGVGYALSVMQNKVVVVATHDVFLSDAVSAFVEKYIQGKAKNGTLSLTVEQEEIKKMTDFYTIAKGGSTDYSVIYPAGTDEMMMEVIEAFVTDLREKTGTQIKLYPDYTDSNEKEIILGVTTRQETEDWPLDYTEYKVLTAEDKIFVLSYSREGLQLGINYLTERLLSIEGDNGAQWLLPKNIGLNGTIEGWIPGVPKFAGGTFQGLFNCSDNTYEISFGNTKLNAFTDYLQTLEKQGFVKHAENQIGANLFKTYKTDKMALHAYYYPNLSVCKIIAEPLSYLPPTTAPSYQKTTSSSLTQIGRVDLAISDNGMSYIIQLEDGSFILIDGGNSNITDAVNLFQFMVENTPGDSKPVIAAWIFSHPHGDHINLPVQFLSLYKDKVIVEMFAYNFADVTNVGHAGDTQGPADYNALVNSVKRAIANNFPNSKVVKVHTGQKFYIRNAVMEILFTHEDLYPRKFKWVNETSLAVRIIVDGTKMLFLGDCEIASNNHMAKVYGNELKSDILQPSHHGYNGATLEIYKLIKPSVCLWACSEKAFKEGKVRAYDFNLYLIDEAGAHFTSSTTTTIPLPYTP